jgi:hypothetical protein
MIAAIQMPLASFTQMKLFEQCTLFQGFGSATQQTI